MYSIMVGVSNFQLLPEQWQDKLFEMLNLKDEDDEED